MSPELLGLLTLVVGVPLNLVVVSLLLAETRREPGLLVLRERFVTALGVLVMVTIFGLIFVNNDTIPPWFDLSATKIITRATMLSLAIVAAVYWLWLYLRH